MTINQLIERLHAKHVLSLVFYRLQVPSQEIPDLCQDLYLSWLSNPDSILKAFNEGYLPNYIKRSCQNQVSKFHEYRSKRPLLDEEFINRLISD